MSRPRSTVLEQNQQFGRLTVLHEIEGIPRRAVMVRCSCGVEKQIALSALVSGAVKSCGCLNREVAAERARARKMAPEDRKPKYVKVGLRHRIDDEGRECSKCLEYKPWAEYNFGNGARMMQSWCRACQSVHHFKKPIAVRRAYGLKHRLKLYSLTVEQYDILVSRYDNCCWRCRKPETAVGPDGTVQRLSVDHDHACCPTNSSCGKCIRGVLCIGCNFLLGHIDGGQVDSYIAYLARGYVEIPDGR